MKSYSLILTAPEVRAVLNGGKTQHRVRIKPQPVQVERYLHGGPTDSIDAASAVMRGPDGKGWACCGPFRCPLGVPGDRLWVRETHITLPACAETGRRASVIYRADGGYPDGYKWNSPVGMPRWASRITLAVESVRVQRVQDISEEDASAEGVAIDCGHVYKVRDYEGLGHMTARGCMETWWGMKHGASWNRNDWVFALTFKRVEVTR